MNPLSTYTYYSRHRRHSALLLSLSVVIVAGLFLMIALVWAVFVEQPRASYMALSKFSAVTPAIQQAEPDPKVLSQLQANPDIAQIIPAKIIPVQLPSIMPGDSFQFDFFGLNEEDLAAVLARLETELKQGRSPAPGSNELLLSVDTAAMLNLTVGDDYETISSEFYANVDAPLEPTTFHVVGILESDIEVGIVSLEFLAKHPLYRHFPSRFLILAREGREQFVDDFLRNEVQDSRTSVRTLSLLNERIVNEALPGLLMLLPIVLIVASTASLVIVVVNHIANSRRLPEFGILFATGHSKRWLTGRLTMETTALAFVGWLAGIGLSWLLLATLKATFFAQRGYDLEFVSWIPIVFTLPLPATIAAFTFISINRTLSRLDPVTIVERGELSQEESDGRKRLKAKSLLKPLAAATFYSRHRRRAVLLIGSMSLMIMAVLAMILALAASADAQAPLIGYLGRAALVRSPDGVMNLDPELVARINDQPAVDRVIPVAPRSHMLDIYIPPFNTAEASPFALYEEDMAYLVDLYDLELKMGRLPRPGTNEMVIPEIVAENRQIGVGTVIGDPNQPAYPGASALPAEFVVSGIFAKPKSATDGDGLGFISLEFLEQTRIFPLPDVMPLIVVSKPGQQAALDDWLEEEALRFDAPLLTHQGELARIQKKAQNDMFSIAILEGIVVLVAAVSLAVLNHIYISQRQTELGVLHALGYSRRQLVGRMVGETTFITVIAWFIGLSICLIGLIFLRFMLFDPRGLTFGLVHVTPWLYTLPIPALASVVTAITTARTLSRLDAVSTVERRIV